MNIRRYIVFMLITLAVPFSSTAQQEHQRQIYSQAEGEYEVGRIEQAKALLLDNLMSFEGSLRQNACRLLALCYLSQDEVEEARYYAEQLIRLNNYYNSADDPARFQDLIRHLKQGIATTITTASSQSESVSEAPVPITIITRAMIEELGYNKNLAQILAAYGPGMAEITSWDQCVNLSVHGAYAMGQELILIMENGRRLNNRFDNSGCISYSVSTEKIDHIEVLRGPASSLYGDVAVSAVVNIITRSGRSLDGVKAKYGYASYNTHKADLTMGTQFMDADIFAWASVYRSDGQLRHFGDGEGYLQPYASLQDDDGLFKVYSYSPDRIYVGAYKDPPCYDIGMTLRLKGFDLSFSHKNVKNVMQLTSSCGGYDYDRYYSLNGIKPGYHTEETHAAIGYSHTYRNVRLGATLYSDWYAISNYEVEYDSVMRISPALDSELVSDTVIEVGNLYYDNFREHTMGGQLRVSADYRLGRLMRGSVLAGAQYEHFSLRSRNFIRLEEFQHIVGGSTDYQGVIDAGKESSLSFFLQDKHYLLPRLILNAGCRLDFKYRQQEDVVCTVSPRLALMYIPSERFSLKLSYSQAFADLSFYMRYISMSPSDNYSMDPQHLSAVQLSAMGSILAPLRLDYEVNLFYNRYTNLLCRQARDFDMFDEHIGKNMGRLSNVGLEATARYASRRLSTSVSLYYCHDIDARHYYWNTEEGMVNGVPHFTLNLHASYRLLDIAGHQLKLYGHAAYTGRKLNYTYLDQAGDFFVEGSMIFDAGVQYLYRQRLQLALDCENIFDRDHYLCGPNYHNAPYFQRGRSLMASLAYQF